MIDFLENVNLNQNELRGTVIEKLASAPTSPTEGQLYYNTVSKELYVYTGSTWLPLKGNVSSVDGEVGDVVLNDAKFTSQSLTNEQKKQVRNNIGAIGSKTGDIGPLR